MSWIRSRILVFICVPCWLPCFLSDEVEAEIKISLEESSAGRNFCERLVHQDDVNDNERSIQNDQDVDTDHCAQIQSEIIERRQDIFEWLGEQWIHPVHFFKGGDAVFYSNPG